MFYSLASVDGMRKSGNATRDSTIGAVLDMAARSRQHSTLNVKEFYEGLVIPLALDQLRTFYNRVGHPLGYCCWAYLSEATQDRVLHSGSSLLFDFEWNEGPYLWIIDFVSLQGALPSIMKHLRDEVFPESKEVRYLRRRSSGIAIAKAVHRGAVSAFWCNPENAPVDLPNA